MPRITADTVVEHVAQQEAAVIAAAARLISERGIAEVSLADIAAEVGLARNSLYRYFPDKYHIVAAWFRAELAPLQDASNAVAADLGSSAPERVRRWLGIQFEYLATPAHRSLIDTVGGLTNLGAEITDDLAHGHRVLYGSLSTIIEDLWAADPSGNPDDRDVRVVTMLVAGLVRSAADVVLGGSDRDAVEGELYRSALALITCRSVSHI